MSALRGCKKLLTIANLLNTRGFQVIGVHVPNAMVDFILIIPLMTIGIFSLILCFENQSYGLFAISSSISIFIGSLSAGAIYVCLAAKTKNLIKLFGSLKRNIKRRKCFLYSIPLFRFVSNCLNNVKHKQVAKYPPYTRLSIENKTIETRNWWALFFGMRSQCKLA